MNSRGMSQDSLFALINTASASTNPLERQAALRLCDEWKATPSNLEPAMNLLAGSRDLSIQLFACNSIEYMIKFLHEKLPNMEELKLFLITRIACNYSRLIRDKISLLISELAIREWPQRWPDLIDLIIASEDRDYSAQILADLVEYIHFKSNELSWHVERKSELQAALVACNEIISKWLLAGIQSHVNSHTKLFSFFCSWADFKPEEFKSLCKSVIKGFVSSRIEPQEFSNFINEVAQRKITFEYDFLLELFFVERFHDIEDGIFKLIPSDYPSFRNIVESVNNMALEFFVNLKHPDVVAKVQSGVENSIGFAIKALQQPSLLVIASSFYYIDALLTAKYSVFKMADSSIEKIIVSFLQIMSADKTTLYASEFNQEDFESFLEFESFLKQLTTLFNEGFRHLSLINTEFVISGLLFLFGQLSISDKSKIIALLMGLGNSLKIADLCGENCAKICSLLTSLGGVTDNDIIYEYESCLMNFCILMGKVNETNKTSGVDVSNMIDIYFQIISKDSTNMEVRCKGFASLVKIASSCPLVFVPKIANVVQLGRFSGGQRELRLYVELVLVLSASKEFIGQKFDLLNSIVTPILGQLELFPILDAESFLSETGIMYIISGKASREIWEIASVYRSKVCNVLTLIQTCSKRLGEMDPASIEAALALVFEKFFEYTVKFLELQALVKDFALWDGTKLHFMVYQQEYGEGDDSEDVIPYISRYLSHLVQICAMIVSYLSESVLARPMLQLKVEFLVSSFTKLQKPSIKSVFLRYVFEPLYCKALMTPEVLAILLETFQKDNLQLLQQREGFTTIYENSATSYINSMTSFVHSIFLTKECGKNELTIDISTRTAHTPASARNSNLICKSQVLSFLTELFYWRSSGPISKSIAIISSHLASIMNFPNLVPFVIEFLPPFLVSNLDLCDVQGILIGLLVECYKWSIYVGKSQHLVESLSKLGVSSEAAIDLIQKLSAPNSVKLQRSEAKKCLEFLIKNPGDAPVVKKLPEKLMIIKKLKHLNQSKEEIDFSSLFE